MTGCLSLLLLLVLAKTTWAASVVVLSPATLIDPANVAYNQDHAAIITNAKNRSFIVWETLNPTTGLQEGRMCIQKALEGQRGPGIPITTHTGLSQITPDVACDDSLRFVVVWCEGSATVGYSVYGKVFYPNGVVLTDDFLISDTPSSEPCFPAVAMNKDGYFVVTWGQCGHGHQNVMVRVYDGLSNAMSSPTVASKYSSTPRRYCLPDIALRDNGDAILVWSLNMDNTRRSVVHFDFNILGGLRFGAKQEHYFREAVEYEAQNRPMISINAAGDAVVCWVDEPNVEGESTTIQATIFNHRYGFWQDPIQINQTTYASMDRADVTVLADGSFVCAWDAVPVGSYNRDIYYQIIQDNGKITLADLLLNSELTGRAQKRVCLGIHDNGVQAQIRATFESGYNTPTSLEDNDVYIKTIQISY